MDLVPWNITVFFISNSFLVKSLVFSIYKFMASSNSDSFLSFQIGCLFFSFSFFLCLIVLTRTSYAMLNINGKSGHLFLFQILEKKFATRSLILAVGLSYMAFIMLRYFPSIPILLRFVINECWILSYAFPACVGIIEFLLSFTLLMCVDLFCLVIC